MSLRRSLRIVPVVDADGNKLYEIPRQMANDYLKRGVAREADRSAIRMCPAGTQKVSNGTRHALSLECRTELHHLKLQGPRPFDPIHTARGGAQ